jgi:hypothetical protein
MSHTNTTANYNLPQFVGTDKPSWLTDVNGAMTSIDTQMKANADATTTTAGDLSTLTGRVTTAEENITTLGSQLSTTANVASSASTTATNANNKANALEAYFNITTFSDLTVSANRGTISNSKMKSAINASGSFGKVYGIVDINGAGGTSPLVITLSDSGMRPATAITINSGAMFTVYDANGFRYMEVADMVINTNGTVSITIPVQTNYTIVRCMITPYVIFAQDFGD